MRSDLRFQTRRSFLSATALALGGAALSPSFAADSVTLPFANGERPLVRYPQKRPLIRLTARPPQLETPFEIFGENILTPNDAFFVRYHLSPSPPPAERLAPEAFRLSLTGSVQQIMRWSVADLKQQFEEAEIVAVNQCSGNSRGFSEPRVPGGQLGNGAMGNARWQGVRLRDVLKKAGVAGQAREVTFNGLDKPVVPQTPDFIKALTVEQALDPDILLAYAMNGEDLPWLNGYPLRLVVPGHYGTYWVKHLHEITVIDKPFDGFWMSTAYRIPDNPCACVPPGTAPDRTVPITRYNVRSFITSMADGAKLALNQKVTIKGIAFDGGSGIAEVSFSHDAGATWHRADLGRDLGKYSFREWTFAFTPAQRGALEFRVKAKSNDGQTQPDGATWNPPGYMRNVIERLRVEVA